MTTKIGKNNQLTKSYDERFRKRLLDSKRRRSYVLHVLQDITENETGAEETLLTLIGCLRDVISAFGSVDKFIEKLAPRHERSTIYKLLAYSPEKEKRKGGPGFITIWDLLETCKKVA